MSYLHEFLEAQRRTIRLGLACPDIHSTDARFFTPQAQSKFPYVVLEAVGELNYEEVVAQCLSIHLRLQKPLVEFFKTPVFFTIGYVYTPPSYMFKQTEDELRQLLQDGANGTRVNLHAWLTLPSMEIIDLSLSTSLAVLNNMPKENHGGVIARHADELRLGLRYHPMLIGDEYLRKIGALREFQVLEY